jgi:hypothetical protein
MTRTLVRGLHLLAAVLVLPVILALLGAALVLEPKYRPW